MSGLQLSWVKAGKLEAKPSSGAAGSGPTEGSGEPMTAEPPPNGHSASGLLLTNGAIEAVTEETAAELRNIIEVQVGRPLPHTVGIDGHR